MVQTHSLASINFTRYITERTEQFAGREWVFKEIDDWLAAPDGPRFLLITGEPGSGKTAIAARLSQFSQKMVPPAVDLPHLAPQFLSAFHFCSSRDTRWIRPLTFTKSLALQLAKCHAAYAEALLEVSGDQQIRIVVQQHIEHAEGPVKGVEINNINFVSEVSPEEAFNRLVREPLEVLFEDDPDQQVIILVDALDEALVYPETTTIPTLLTHTEALPASVRFILTSRPDIDLVRSLRLSPLKEVKLTSGEGLTQSVRDIRQYVLDSMNKSPELEEKLVPGLTRQALIDAIEEKSEGNFLYASYLFKMFQEQSEQISLAQLNTLPPGLNGIYTYFLQDRLVKSNPQSWEAEYKPVLGALAVAQVPFNQAQLADLLGWSESELRMTLKKLHQLLNVDEALPANKRTYSIYHRSFIDFLLDENQSEEYQLEGKKEHLRLADWCEKGNVSTIWEDVRYAPGEQGRREYARQYYIIHLYLAQEWTRLFNALDSSEYGRANVRFDPSTRSYADDLYLGQLAATWAGWPKKEAILLLSRLWQYTLLLCSLSSRAEAYTPALRVLVLMEREQQALAITDLLPEPEKRAEALLQIAGQLQKRGDEDNTCLEIVQRACEIARTMQNGKDQGEVLTQAAGVLLQGQQWEQAESLVSMIDDPFAHAFALVMLGAVLAEKQQWERAEPLLRKAKEAIDEIEVSDYNTEEYTQKFVVRESLIGVLVELRQWEWAEQEIEKVGADGWRGRVIMLGELAVVLARAQAKERVWTVLRKITEEIDSIEDEELRTEAAEELVPLQATALVHIEEWEAAQEAIEQIGDGYKRMQAFSELWVALVKAQQQEHAQVVCQHIADVLGTIESDRERVGALIVLAETATQAGQRELAEELWQGTEEVIAAMKEDGERAYASDLEKYHESLERYDEGDLLKPSMSDELARLLREFGAALARAEQMERAEIVWREAAQMTCRIDEGFQASEQKELVDILIQAQCWKLAREVIGMMDPSGFQLYAMIDLVEGLAQAGQWKQAREVWKETEGVINTPDESGRPEALEKLAIALAQTRQWERAESAIDITGKGNGRYSMRLMRKYSTRPSAVWHELVDLLIQAREWDRAESAIGKVEEKEKHIDALQRLAVALIEAQKVERGDTVWQEAEEVIGTIEQIGQRINALLELADLLLEAHQRERAETVWHRVEELIETIKPDQRSYFQKGFGIALARAQQWEWAKRVIGTIENNILRAGALRELGTAFIEGQKREQAMAAWREAEELIGTIEVNIQRVRELGQLGATLIKARQVEWAETLWEESKKLIAILDMPDVIAIEILSVLGESLAQVQQKQQAEQVWQEAEERLARLSDGGSVRITAGQLAQTLIQVQEWDRAERVIDLIGEDGPSMYRDLAVQLAWAREWDHALKIVQEKIKLDFERAEVLSELVVALATNGELERANRVWNEAIQIIDSVDGIFRASALCRLAQVTNDKALLNLIAKYWGSAATRDDAFRLFPMVTELISRYPELGASLQKAFVWVDAFFQG